MFPVLDLKDDYLQMEFYFKLTPFFYTCKLIIEKNEENLSVIYERDILYYSSQINQYLIPFLSIKMTVHEMNFALGVKT